MNYQLNKTDAKKESEKGVLVTALKRLWPLMREERRQVSIALVAIVIVSATSLLGPEVIARTVDASIQQKDMVGLLSSAGILLLIFLVGGIANYVQVLFMGGVGRRVLFNLRNAIFTKLQELPVAFFNQNKAGDLISRINNDTDKLNQFFAQALMQFIGNGVLIVGTGVCMFFIQPRLTLAALVPASLVLLLTQVISPWVKRTNLRSLQKLGGMSGEIQESLNNFKVIVAFNRLDYFRTKFREVNEMNYTASVAAGIANNTFTPLYTLAGTLAQFVVLGYGIFLIEQKALTLGLLIGFILYVNNFYTPLRQLASVWSSLQQALAGLDRISEVLALESDLPVTLETKSVPHSHAAVLEFSHVSFAYPNGKEVLHDVNIALEKGKTYALVGPTGGGKTTTASLMARLYDPTKGTVFFLGKDMRSYSSSERAKRIGFILQEPFLFTGTVKENILYGNDAYAGASDEDVVKLLESTGLITLLDRFPEGLATKVVASGDAVSVGQKQLVAFMRATLRNPELLILDEATANIDTVTEKLLEEILEQLPAETTRVIIAHRLNTIQNADAIFFVNESRVLQAGTMEHAVNLLLHTKRES